MKKFLLLLAVAMLSVSAFAAKSVHLKSKAQWGEYMLSTTVPFSAEDYVSMKVTVANAVGAFQVKVTSTDIADDDYTNPAYPQFENNVCVFNFQDFLTSKGYTGNINRINLQACDGADQEIDVLEVILVKADGTEVVQELGGDAWGGGAFEATELEYQGGSGEEPVAEGKCLDVTCAEAKAYAWDSQIFINFPKVLEKGVKYTITMDIKGTDALAGKDGQYGKEAIQPVVQDANSDNKDEWGGPADLQYLSHFEVTTDWVKNVKDCEGNDIVTDGAFPYSRLLLNLGNYAGTLSVDNIRAIDEEGNEYFCITFDTAEEQALVENGWMNLPKAFTTGIESVGVASSEVVAYDLFGRVGATKGLMVKGGKVVYVK